MLPPLFYIPPGNRDGNLLLFPAEEAKHAARVLRLKPGAIIVAIDGLGSAWRAEIVSATARKVTARIHSELRELGETAVKLTLAAGLSTGLKFDAVVQRGTELGVSRFVPLLTEKSKVAMPDQSRSKARRTRLLKVALAATKQCRRSCLPEVSEPLEFQTYLDQTDPGDSRLIFHAGRASRPFEAAMLGPAAKRVSLLVGPEAGFTDTEVEAAIRSGFTVVSLGPRVLRSETAGPVVVALVMHCLNELR